ncbi:MAG: hypothetical protein IPG23_28660 [Burkholderiales bacterium]|nr:hypothetical protein [Burkholderiales bacterium]
MHAVGAAIGLPGKKRDKRSGVLSCEMLAGWESPARCGNGAAVNVGGKHLDR